MTDVTQELLAVNQRLLDAIAGGDWPTYIELCAADLTAFEPESAGHLVEGLGFHQFYFDLGGPTTPHHTTMVAPHVRMLGERAAVVCYVRLVQRIDGAGNPIVARSEETRVWTRGSDGRWKHVHFHRSK